MSQQKDINFMFLAEVVTTSPFFHYIEHGYSALETNGHIWVRSKFLVDNVKTAYAPSFYWQYLVEIDGLQIEQVAKNC